MKKDNSVVSDIDPKKLSKENEELWDADPKCDHEIIDPPGGGIKCIKCGGWFCY